MPALTWYFYPIKALIPAKGVKLLLYFYTDTFPYNCNLLLIYLGFISIGAGL